jgi:AbrB family looped-hinge helix DNA binding protein
MEHWVMGAATLTERGQIVVPADIRRKYGLSAGTQVEFVDDGGTIRLVVRRRVAPSDPQAGFGMIKVKSRGAARRLAEFDPASLLRRSRR